MRCPRCQHENREGARYCETCGSPLAHPCPNCGNVGRPSATYCDHCGTALTDHPPAAKPPATPPHAPASRSATRQHLVEKILYSEAALAGERKQVTVLFADLKGSMELLADRDPEEARQLLDPILTLMMDAVHHYDGTVNQVMGDGIMALFGAPIAHEDHAARACYAALVMQEVIERHAKEAYRRRGLEVQIRIGLNSGEVVVRSLDSDLHMDYSAVGQTTHLAARMEQLARPGTILLTAGTWGLVEGYFEVQPVGAVSVKGLTTPVQAYELLRAKAVRSRLQVAATRGLTPFVGREAELAVLRQALMWAQRGHGQMVALVGEPGVGRSRLIYEFTQRQPPPGWRILEGRAASYGEDTLYLPVIGLLRSYFQLTDHDDPEQIREKLTGKLLALEGSLGPLLQPLQALLDSSAEDPQWQALDPAQRRQRTLDAVQRLLLWESQIQPLLLVFEDLHWLDAGTQGILDTLVESLAGSPLLLLVSYRPEYEHHWGGKTYYTQLRIEPLPSEEAATLLQALLGANPSLDLLKRRLIERTDGNPLFLEESVRTLVETKILIGESGAYRLMQARRRSSLQESPELAGERAAYHLMRTTESIHVPATVQAVVAARIDRLPVDAKTLLQTAAVIGTEVPFGLLQLIAGRPEEPLRQSLRRLQAAEFLYEAHLFPELVYTFKHALTHEVAYGSLLQERRRTLHARLVEAIEALYPDRLAEHAERLAHHAMRGEVWDKAAAYCRQAGAKACDRGSLREAVTIYEQALDALGHLPETPDTARSAIELHHLLGYVLSLLGEYSRSLALLGEAEGRARQLDDRVRLGQVLSTVTIVHRARGDLDGAMAAGHQALELGTSLGDPALQIETSLRLGQAYFAMGDFGRAAELLRGNVEALARADERQERSREIISRAWLAWVLGVLGEFAEGRRHGEEALRLAMAEKRREAPVIAHGCLGLLYLEQGDWDAAVQVLDQGLALGRASGDRNWSMLMVGGLGEAHARAGRLEEGRKLLEETLSASLTTEALLAYPAHVTHLSAVDLLAGRLAEARQHVEKALDLARQQKARGNEARALFQLGSVHAHTVPTDVQVAEAYYREALALAGRLYTRPLQAHCHLGLGTLYAKIGQTEHAQAELSTAIDLYRAMGMTFWLTQTEARLVQVEGAHQSDRPL
jgi:class 3 adenylate cyclase/tetratricopeptide (TPR) repeat protein